MNPKKQPKIKVDDDILIFIYGFSFEMHDATTFFLAETMQPGLVAEKLAKLLGVKVTKKGLKELKEGWGLSDAKPLCLLWQNS